MKKERSLLHDFNVEEEGRLCIDTSSGAHVTSEEVLEKLKKRNSKKDSTNATQGKKHGEEHDDIRECADARRRYAQLSDYRFGLRKRLRERAEGSDSRSVSIVHVSTQGRTILNFH